MTLHNPQAMRALRATPVVRGLRYSNPVRRFSSNISIDVPHDHPQLQKKALEIYAEHGAVVVRGLNKEYVQVRVVWCMKVNA